MKNKLNLRLNEIIHKSFYWKAMLQVYSFGSNINLFCHVENERLKVLHRKLSSSEGTFFNKLSACRCSSKLLWGWVYTKTSLWNKGNNRNSFLFPISSHLRTDDERLYWQFVFGSKLTIVSLLCKDGIDN